MPVLPCQSLGTCANKAVQFISEKTNKITKKYAIISVVIFEIVSIPLAYFLWSDYSKFWYPFLTNNMILILIYSHYCNRKILRYCQRTTVALRFLQLYFFLNSFVLLTGAFVNIYYSIVTYLLLTVAFIILLLTMYKTKK